MSLHDLPNEILLQILQRLSYNDLKIVSQTSKRFYIVATDPNLWRDFTSARKSISLKIGMLRMPRFQNLKFVNFSNTFEDSNKNRLVFKKNRHRITPKFQVTAFFELLANMKVEEIHFEKFNFKNFNSQLQGVSKKTPVSGKMATIPPWKVLGEKVVRILKNSENPLHDWLTNFAI